MQGVRDMGNQREGRSQENKESFWGIMEENCLNYRINSEKPRKHEETSQW